MNSTHKLKLTNQFFAVWCWIPRESFSFFWRDRLGVCRRRLLLQAANGPTYEECHDRIPEDGGIAFSEDSIYLESSPIFFLDTMPRASTA